jgi:hypothetical protein
MPVEKLSPSHRLEARFFFDGLLPFVLLIGVSLFTRPLPAASLDQFFGKMKTPVAADPEADVAVMVETVRNPHRFDHQKLFPASNWEFTKWNRVDTLGFFACLGVSGGIILLFWALLRLAAP